jgi:CMP-N-acetylneuraminic acid synthetase
MKVDMSKAVAFIFARGGSRGLVNKNILDFAGKPLIAWTISQALENSRIDQVIVSTDSPIIADISAKYGAEVPFIRPTELANDDSPEILSWKHALNFIHGRDGVFPEIFLSLPCTSPLREQSDINRNLDCLIENQGDLAISICPSQRSPYFNMVNLDESFRAQLAIPSQTSFTRRQDAPKTFDITTVAYSARPQYIMETNKIMSGKVFASIVERRNAIDIDDSFDFEIAEYLFKKKREMK